MEIKGVAMQGEGGIIEVSIEGEDGIKDLIDGIGGERERGEGVKRKERRKMGEHS